MWWFDVDGDTDDVHFDGDGFWFKLIWSKRSEAKDIWKNLPI